MNDPVNHPAHYTAHPSGVEAVDITEHYGFCIGNAIKYLYRLDGKGNALQDAKKAAWYVEREIGRRTAKSWDPGARARNVEAWCEHEPEGDVRAAMELLCDAGTKGYAVTDLRAALRHIQAEIESRERGRQG